MADGTISLDFRVPVGDLESDLDRAKKLISAVGDHAGDSLDDNFAKNADKMVDSSKSASDSANDKLSNVGDGTGDGMDDNFAKNAAKVTDKAGDTSKSANDQLDNVGDHTGDGMDDNFSANAEKIVDKANSTGKDADQRLESVGENVGDGMDDSFRKNADKVEDTAGSTKKSVDSKFKNPTKAKIEGDVKDISAKVSSSRALLRKVPKKTITRLTADAQKHGIVNFGSLLKKLPKKQLTELLAKAEKGEVINYGELLRSIPKEQLTNLKLNDNASPELKHIQEEAEQTSSKFSQLKDIVSGSLIGNVAAQGISKVTGYLGGLIGEAEDASDAMEGFRSTMQFGGFGEKEIQSASKAVKKYADETVYDLGDVTSTTAQLAANGVKGYEQLTEAAGNLTAVAGGTKDDFKSVAMVMTQTAGAGKLTTENWNQLTDAIPGASGKLQEAMKKNGAFTGNFRDAMEKGQISADEFNKAISQLGMTDKAKEFARGTAEFQGAFGNLEAEVVTGMTDIVDAIGKKNITDAINGLASVATKGFGVVVDMIKSVKKHADDLKSIGGSLGEIAKIFGSAVWEAIADPIRDVASAFSKMHSSSDKSKGPLKAVSGALAEVAKHKGAIKDVASAVAGLATAFVAFKTMTAIKSGFVGLIGTIGKLKGAFETLTLVMMENPFIAIAAAIIGLGVALTSLYKHNKKFRDFVNGIASGAKEAFTKTIKWFQDLGKSVKKVFNGLVDWWKTNWKDVGLLIVNPIGGAVNLLYKHNKKFRDWANSVLDAIKGVFKGVGKWFSGIWDSISKGAKKGWNGIKKVVKIGAEGIKIVALAPLVLLSALVVAIWDKIKKPTKKAWDLIKKYIVDPIKSAVKSVQKFLKSMQKEMSRIGNAISKQWHKIWDSVSSFFGKTWSKLKKTASSGYNAVKNGVSSAWGSVKNKFHSIWGPVASFFGQKWSQMKKSASSGYNSVKNGVSSAWGSAKNKFHSIWGPVASFFGQKWGQMKKSASSGWNYIKNGVGGAWDSVSAKWHKIWGGLRDTFSSIWGSIKSSAKNGMNAVIGFINGGIGGINKTVKFFGGKKNVLSKIPKLASGTAPLTQETPAIINDQAGSTFREAVWRKNGEVEIPTSRNVFTWLNPGDAVMPAQATKHTFGNIPQFKGGIGDWMSKMWNGAKGIGEDIADGAEDLFDALSDVVKHPLKTLQSLFTKTKNSAAGVFHDIAGGAGKWIPTQAVDWFKKQLKKLEDDAGGSMANPKGQSVNRWKPAVKKALSKNGLPTSAAYVNAWLRQIQTESGGNPKAVQGYIPGDPNNGNPARGLLQTIPDTFSAHAFKNHHNIFNGYDNILAAIAYAKARYGSSMLAVIGHNHGYDNGGYVNKPQLAPLAEHNGEYVVNPQRDSADNLLVRALNERAAYAPNSLSAKMAGIVRNANSSNGRAILPTGGLDTSDTGSISLSNRDYNQQFNRVNALLDKIAQKRVIVDGPSFSKVYESYGSTQRAQRQMYSDRGLAINANIN